MEQEWNVMSQSKYFAFLSYSWEDRKWASWLQHHIEHYRLPSNLNGREDLPKYIRPIFMDASDMSLGYLPEVIKDALSDSEYLIVICSPSASKSHWVDI